MKEKFKKTRFSISYFHFVPRVSYRDELNTSDASKIVFPRNREGGKLKEIIC
jgi:hypothetical protein